MTYPHPEHPETEPDPYDSASTAELAPRAYYGQLHVDCWFCALVKGQGKVPFDAQAHGADQRCTAIDMSLVPISAQNVTRELKREMIEQSREWAGIVWPAIKEAGVAGGLWATPKEAHLRKVNGAWVKAIFVGTGRKYRTQGGEEREATTFKVEAIFRDQEACVTAYYADTHRTPPEEDGTEPIAGLENAAPASAPVADKERETALAFLKVIVQQNKGNRHAIAAQIATMPMISKFFSADSPEVDELIAAA
jgi:hypothetical protein